MGLPTRWRTMITTFNPPYMFVDQQIHGPYSMWHHTHTFKKLSEEETLIEDIVKYCVPFGFIGGIVHYLYIKIDLESIFSYRKEKIKEIFSD